MNGTHNSDSNGIKYPNFEQEFSEIVCSSSPTMSKRACATRVTVTTRGGGAVDVEDACWPRAGRVSLG